VDGLRGTVVCLTFFNLKAPFIASCYSVINVSVHISVAPLHVRDLSLHESVKLKDVPCTSHYRGQYVIMSFGSSQLLTRTGNMKQNLPSLPRYEQRVELSLMCTNKRDMATFNLLPACLCLLLVVMGIGQTPPPCFFFDDCFDVLRRKRT